MNFALVAPERMGQAVPELIDAGNVVISRDGEDRGGEIGEELSRGLPLAVARPHGEVPADHHAVGSESVRGGKQGLHRFGVLGPEVQVGEVEEFRHE